VIQGLWKCSEQFELTRCSSRWNSWNFRQRALNSQQRVDTNQVLVTSNSSKELLFRQSFLQFATGHQVTPLFYYFTKGILGISLAPSLIRICDRKSKSHICSGKCEWMYKNSNNIFVDFIELAYSISRVSIFTLTCASPDMSEQRTSRIPKQSLYALSKSVDMWVLSCPKKRRENNIYYIHESERKWKGLK